MKGCRTGAFAKLASARAMIVQYSEESGPCDHAVNICNCDIRDEIESFDSATDVVRELFAIVDELLDDVAAHVDVAGPRFGDWRSRAVAVLAKARGEVSR